MRLLKPLVREGDIERLPAGLVDVPGIGAPAHQLFHEVHLDLLDLQEFLPLVFEQDVEFLMKVADFQLGFEIHLVVIFRAQTVLRFHAVLAHHDDRRLDRGETGQNQIEQYIWIGIEGAPQSGAPY